MMPLRPANCVAHGLDSGLARLPQEEYRMWQRSTAPVTHDTEEAEVQGRETSGGFGNGKLYRPQVSTCSCSLQCEVRLVEVC